MGNTPSQNNVAVAQAPVNIGNLTEKINSMGIIMMSLALCVVAVIMYGIRAHCHRRAKRWFRREMAAVNAGGLTTPVVRVQTVQQQPAASTTTGVPGSGYV